MMIEMKAVYLIPSGGMQVRPDPGSLQNPAALLLSYACNAQAIQAAQAVQAVFFLLTSLSPRSSTLRSQSSILARETIVLMVRLGLPFRSSVTNALETFRRLASSALVIPFSSMRETSCSVKPRIAFSVRKSTSSLNLSSFSLNQKEGLEWLESLEWLERERRLFF